VAISETARRNHDQLFPGLSTLKVTDPALIEIFHNLAFNETLRHSRLDTRTRLWCSSRR
jgi:4-carboxymuconolactone decarboxylase